MAYVLSVIFTKVHIIALHTCVGTLPTKSLEYSENIMETLAFFHLNLLQMDWHQPQINMVI